MPSFRFALAFVALLAPLALVGHSPRIAAASTAPFRAEVRACDTVPLDFGGGVIKFAISFVDYRVNGKCLAVTGLCVSSCTLSLGAIDRRNLCATDDAVFAFHSASNTTREGDSSHSPEGTRLVWFIYPKALRELLRARGWDGDGVDNAHPDLIFIPAYELRAIVRPCVAGEV